MQTDFYRSACALQLAPMRWSPVGLVCWLAKPNETFLAASGPIFSKLSFKYRSNFFYHFIFSKMAHIGYDLAAPVPANSHNFFLSTDDETFTPPANIQKTAHVSSFDQYLDMYQKSVQDPDAFWADILNGVAKFHFSTPYSKLFEYNFDIRRGPIFIRWMVGAKLNVCYNVLDKHVDEGGLGDKIAFYWEGNTSDDSYHVTYRELLTMVKKFGMVLRKKGVSKGDRVVICLPVIVETVVAMLACARIGAIHSVVFAGYSAESLASRILDAEANVLVTADGMWRGATLIKIKEIADEAVEICRQRDYQVKHTIVVSHVCAAPHHADTNGMTNGYTVNGTGPQHNGNTGKRPCMGLTVELKERETWYHNEMAAIGDHEECPVEWMDAEDPLFMLYTSGSTGKPKGVVHTQAGYLLHSFLSFRYVFDYQPDDVYYCTADFAWITGHTYVAYGPLANGATTVMYAGVPTYPDAGRLWEIVDKYRVTKFYSAPTIIRGLMQHGDSFVQKHSRKSLVILSTVGEPINPGAWVWYNDVVGEKRCAIVDTYFQTETGGHLLSPLPGCTPTKAGSATFPFFGVQVALLDKDGEEIEGPGEGYLVMKRPWPGIMRTVYRDHDRFQDTYFKRFPGYYFTGDGCIRDEDGYYWITGRVDDMMNVNGYLASTAEFESALVSHKLVAEAAVVAAPRDVMGHVPYCFVTLKNGYELTEELTEELKALCLKKLGLMADPMYLQRAPTLPKTRSGKIMRRILRKIASGETREFGDTTALTEEGVIENLVNNRVEVTDEE